MGKTTLATKFAKSCIVIHPNEDGVGDLKGVGQVPQDYPVFECKTWEECHQLVDHLIEHPDLFKCVTFDTANTLLQRVLFEFIQQDQFNGEWTDFQNWDKGVKRAVPEWDNFLNKLTTLRRKGVTVVLLCHCRKTDFRNPEGNNYMRYQPDLYDSSRPDGPSILAPTKRWASDIGFMDYVVEAEKGKGKGGRQRRLRFQHEAAFDAKSRLGIKESIDMGYTPDEGYKAFIAACKQATQQGKGE